MQAYPRSRDPVSGGFADKRDRPASKGGTAKPRMFAARGEAAAKAFEQRESLVGLQGLPLAERAGRAVAQQNRGGRGQR